jgi:hypothetical protein
VKSILHTDHTIDALKQEAVLVETYGEIRERLGFCCGDFLQSLYCIHPIELLLFQLGDDFV